MKKYKVVFYFNGERKEFCFRAKTPAEAQDFLLAIKESGHLEETEKS